MIALKNNKLVTCSDKALSAHISDVITPSWRPHMTVQEGQVIIEFDEPVAFPQSDRGLDFSPIPGSDMTRWLVTYTNPDTGSALRIATNNARMGRLVECRILEANLANMELDGLLDVEDCVEYSNIVVADSPATSLFDCLSRPSYNNILLKNLNLPANTFESSLLDQTLTNVIFDNCYIHANTLGGASLINCAMLNCEWYFPFDGNPMTIQDCVFIGCTLDENDMYHPTFSGKNVFIDCDISFGSDSRLKELNNCEFTNCRLHNIFMPTVYGAPRIYTDSCICTEVFQALDHPLSLNNWQVYGSASQFHNIIRPLHPQIWEGVYGVLDFYNRCKAAGVSDVNGSACFGTSADKPHTGDWLQIPVSWGGLL